MQIENTFNFDYFFSYLFYILNFVGNMAVIQEGENEFITVIQALNRNNYLWHYQLKMASLWLFHEKAKGD